MARHRIFGMSFARIYALYVTKVERKGHGTDQLDQVISWLTGYDEAGLEKVIADEIDLETFFDQAPVWNPNASLITGVICGIRVEDIEDPLMQKVRYLDKLVDEVARGKKMTSILRGEPTAARQSRSSPAPGGARCQAPRAGSLMSPVPGVPSARP
ncbi:DUF2200 domain-containing protein [Cellulosimicrobium terreum]|nr:DUF2200 domain-containing protein [Cellulosimicrobium terreum]